MTFFHANVGKRSRVPKWEATANRDLTDRSSLLAAMPTSTPKPAYLSSVNDPVYGTKIIRVSGDPGTTNSGVTWGTQARWHYSADQAWNCDETKMMIADNSGGSAVGNPVLLNGQTYAVIQAAVSPPYDWRWHPTDPTQCIYVQSAGVFGLWNPVTGSKTTITTFSGYTACTIGGGNGGPSQMTQNKSTPIVPIQATRNSDSKVVLFSYDMLAGTKSIDIVSGTGQGYNACWATPDGVNMVFNDIGASDTYDAQYIANRTTGSILLGPYGSTSNGSGSPSEPDLTLDGSGVPYLCGVDKQNSGRGMKRNCVTGALTDLTTNSTANFASHCSCQASGYPGWILLTYYGHNDGADSDPLYLGEMIAIQIDGSGNPYRLCHHFSWNSGASYYAQVQATWSPTGTRLAWKGNWGDPNGNGFPVQCYVADLR